VCGFSLISEISEISPFMFSLEPPQISLKLLPLRTSFNQKKKKEETLFPSPETNECLRLQPYQVRLPLLSSVVCNPSS